MKHTRFAAESAAQAHTVHHFRITYKQENVPVSIVTANMMKYDSGVALLIRKNAVDSRVVAVINTESIREIIEVEGNDSVGPETA